MSRVLVTGANGFVGRALCEALAARGIDYVAAIRQGYAGFGHGVIVGDIDGQTNWAAALQGIDRIVHLASRVHVMRETTTDPLSAFRKVNTEGTLNLARQAMAAGVRRFVFVSTVKVNGEGRSRPYRESDSPEPGDPYAVSKCEAECALRELVRGSGMEVVVVRPPLVYGPGVSANFLRLMQAVHSGWPLPLGCVRNARSMIFVGNLTDVILLCLTHAQAAHQTFLVRDGEDLSTTELLRGLGVALEKPARLLPVPVRLMKWVGYSLGQSDVVHRLCGSLQVDSSRVSDLLGWTPPFSTDEGLRLTAREFLQSKQSAGANSR